MSIRTRYSGDPRIQRKIDQHYEMAALARLDGDYVDEKLHLEKIRKLELELRGGSREARSEDIEEGER